MITSKVWAPEMYYPSPSFSGIPGDTGFVNPSPSPLVFPLGHLPSALPATSSSLTLPVSSPQNKPPTLPEFSPRSGSPLVGSHQLVPPILSSGGGFPVSGIGPGPQRVELPAKVSPLGAD